jgi:hypothetical protein
MKSFKNSWLATVSRNHLGHPAVLLPGGWQHGTGASSSIVTDMVGGTRDVPSVPVPGPLEGHGSRVEPRPSRPHKVGVYARMSKPSNGPPSPGRDPVRRRLVERYLDDQRAVQPVISLASERTRIGE